MFCRVAHRTNLHIGTARRDRDHHLQRRAEQTAIAFDHTDQSPKHQFCRIEIGDHAIFQRTDRANILMGFTMHLAGLLTDSHQLTGMLVVATIEGSSTTILPLFMIIVLAVPKSMANSCVNENRPIGLMFKVSQSCKYHGHTVGITIVDTLLVTN